MDDRDADRCCLRSARRVQRANPPEFIGDLRDAVHEIRETLREVQIAAEPDAVDRSAEQGAPHGHPVFARVERGIAALHERRRAAQSDREKIRVQAEFVDRDVDAGAEARLVAGEHAFDEAVESELMEPPVVRFDPDPAVVVEDVGFLAVAVHDVDQLAPERDHEVVDERHPVGFAFRAWHVRHVKLAPVHEILGRQAVAVPFRKLVQSLRADREIVGRPVGIQMPAAFAAAPNPHEIVEHGREPHDRGRRMRFAPAHHPVAEIRARFLVPRVDLHQVFGGPVVRGVVVHGNLLPDAEGHEARGIGVVRHGRGDRHDTLTITPLRIGQKRVRRTVVYLPVFARLGALVDLELPGEEFLHQRDRERTAAHRGHGRGHQECLLKFIAVCLRPLIVVADDADRGVDAVSGVQDLLRELRAVAVPDHVGAPFFRQFQRQVFIAGFARQRKKAAFRRVHKLVLHEDAVVRRVWIQSSKEYTRFRAVMQIISE